jgi:hypothetical protein
MTRASQICPTDDYLISSCMNLRIPVPPPLIQNYLLDPKSCWYRYIRLLHPIPCRLYDELISLLQIGVAAVAVGCYNRLCYLLLLSYGCFIDSLLSFPSKRHTSFNSFLLLLTKIIFVLQDQDNNNTCVIKKDADQLAILSKSTSSSSSSSITTTAVALAERL